MDGRVTIAELEDALREEAYPFDAAEMREVYGDVALDLANGEETITTILDRSAPEDRFEDPEAVLERIYCGISVAGVGRPNYTDRGGIAGLDARESF